MYFDPARLLAEQLARPRGLPGRAVGWAMDLLNRAPARLSLDLLEPRAGEEILDAGCGTGAAMAMLVERSHCAITGIDRSPTMLARARRRLGPRVGLALGDLSAMPFAQAQFDAVIALNVLYFCDPAGSMLCEMRRVLRPGGRLVAYVTDRETMERWSFVRKGMHRLFDETSLVAAFAAAGFEPNSTSVTVARIAHGVTGLFAVGRR